LSRRDVGLSTRWRPPPVDEAKTAADFETTNNLEKTNDFEKANDLERRR